MEVTNHEGTKEMEPEDRRRKKRNLRNEEGRKVEKRKRWRTAGE